MNFHFCLIYSGVCYGVITAGRVSLFSRPFLLPNRLTLKQALKNQSYGRKFRSDHVAVFLEILFEQREWKTVDWCRMGGRSKVCHLISRSGLRVSKWDTRHTRQPAEGLTNAKQRIRLFKVQLLLKTAEKCTEPHLWQEGGKNKREICSMSFHVPFGVYFGHMGQSLFHLEASQEGQASATWSGACTLSGMGSEVPLLFRSRSDLAMFASSSLVEHP